MQTLDPTHLRRHIKSGGALFLVFLVALVFAISCWTIVSAGHTGVQTLFGKVKDEELSSGFHIKNPLVHITELSVRTEDYTMSVTQGEGEKTGPDAISALTKEGLNVVLDITVLYHLQEDKASDMYRDVGLDYDNVVIRPLTRSTIREVVAQYDVKDIYSEKRGEASQQILEVLQSKLNPRGIEVEDVLLRNVLLPENLASSIEAKLQAEQESQRYEFVLEKEKKEAERKRLEAEGQRDAQQIINQSLTTRYLEYLYIESLKDREGTIYVPTNPSNGIPLLRGL